MRVISGWCRIPSYRLGEKLPRTKKHIDIGGGFLWVLSPGKAWAKRGPSEKGLGPAKTTTDSICEELLMGIAMADHPPHPAPPPPSRYVYIFRRRWLMAWWRGKMCSRVAWDEKWTIIKMGDFIRKLRHRESRGWRGGGWGFDEMVDYILAKLIKTTTFGYFLP